MFMVPKLLLGNPCGPKALLCTQGATPMREVAEARQSLASKSVPKQELGDEVRLNNLRLSDFSLRVI
jgi:hypothetical protein